MIFISILVIIWNFCVSMERQDAIFFNLELVEMMGESRVFMYPDLLPKLAIYQTEPGNFPLSLELLSICLNLCL